MSEGTRYGGELRKERIFLSGERRYRGELRKERRGLREGRR
jgi:hypothetical protein